MNSGRICLLRWLKLVHGTLNKVECIWPIRIGVGAMLTLIMLSNHRTSRPNIAVWLSKVFMKSPVSSFLLDPGRSSFIAIPANFSANSIKYKSHHNFLHCIQFNSDIGNFHEVSINHILKFKLKSLLNTSVNTSNFRTLICSFSSTPITLSWWRWSMYLHSTYVYSYTQFHFTLTFHSMISSEDS